MPEQTFTRAALRNAVLLSSIALSGCSQGGILLDRVSRAVQAGFDKNEKAQLS